MKLASRRSGRDGELLVISRDLTRAVSTSGIAPTLQAALDRWDEVAPALARLSEELDRGKVPGQPFVPAQCHSPLPRAFQWADGSAYVNHVELVRRARGAVMPASFWHDPLMYQGGSDDFLAPTDPIPFLDPAFGLDFEGEVAVITGDVPMGITAAEAGGCIRLILLVNDVSLRGLIPGELDKGFGFYQSKPATAFSPVAVTPDELGDAWSGARVQLPLLCTFNGQPFGRAHAGIDMTFSFADLIAHAARTRNLCAGTIIGSGTVSNKQGAGHGSAIRDGGVGYSCIAELRMIETLRDGAPSTGFMQPGDHIRIEMFDRSGQSVFGAIDQVVRAT